MPTLNWLPTDPDWKAKLAALPTDHGRWAALRDLAGSEMDFVRTGALDRRSVDTPVASRPDATRIALLSSSTVDHLLPGLRVAGLRRGLSIDTYVPYYGQERQALLAPDPDLVAFDPQVVVFAPDPWATVGDSLLDDADGKARVTAAVADVTLLWDRARDRFGAQVIQQTLLPVFSPLMGGAEHRAPGSPAQMVRAFNGAVREAAAREGVDILALDDRAAFDGLDQWHSSALWHRAKQAISPAASPFWGELCVRIVAAMLGRSAKCLVLDLDNTLWGGVIGDDGLEGIVLGQGNAEGEAFAAFQRYVKALGRRGVILAVCSKNDEANALEAFEKHPETVLRRDDFAAFFANWDDKATNLRRIAAELNIGIDSLVFVDDNPFERNIVRRELPEVWVPELPDDPALYAQTVADAGYFEALELTAEDSARNALYQATRALRSGDVEASDLQGYLASLDMALEWSRLDEVSLKRVTQLANKTNQFNLTTRRYTEAEIAALRYDPKAIVISLRLRDIHADHGIIAVIVGRGDDRGTLDIETWLMSCRVLGRGVEQATLAAIADIAGRHGYERLRGTYRPSAKNAMVRDHYPRLGFSDAGAGEAGETYWSLALAKRGTATFDIRIVEK